MIKAGTLLQLWWITILEGMIFIDWKEIQVMRKS